MGYKVREDVTREQLIAAVEALNPFYAFGSVLSLAQQDGGYAWVDLYSGEPETDTGIDAQPDSCTSTLDRLADSGCIVGVNSTIARMPFTNCGPVLLAQDFFRARDAFLACVEDKSKKEQDDE